MIVVAEARSSKVVMAELKVEITRGKVAMSWSSPVRWAVPPGGAPRRCCSIGWTVTLGIPRMAFSPVDTVVSVLPVGVDHYNDSVTQDVRLRTQVEEKGFEEGKVLLPSPSGYFI